jgi:hypothetical protein
MTPRVAVPNPRVGRAFAASAAVLSVLLAACESDLQVPDYNNPSLEELEGAPTRAAIAAGATGLIIGGRDEIDDRNGYLSLLGILGRESYNFDGADPRFVTEMLESPLSASSPAFGGNLWAERYRNIRTGTIVLNGLERVTGLSDEEREATRGFVKTMQAHELLLLVNTRDANGVALDFDREPTADPAPLSTRTEALERVIGLLTEARTHLAAAGAVFPFGLGSGFEGFDTPATFLRFNRALEARVEVYRGNHAAALAALGQSFITTDAGQLDLGVYHAFGGGSGDSPNELFDPGETPDILAHPSIVTDAPRRADGSLDLRAQAKIRTLPQSQTTRGITTGIAFTIYDDLTAPIPIIRNEELILLRAEANIGTGNAAAALNDLNFIRVNAGGLAPLTSPAQATLDEVLLQRRYSLLFEGGHRWIDLRRTGRLAQLPLDRPSHTRNEMFPIPEAECLARGPQTTCSAGGT